MKCPKCPGVLQERLARNAVLIDVCGSCSCVWLDAGEINFFVTDRRRLDSYYKEGLSKAQPVLMSCPKCSLELNQGTLPGFSFAVEECSGCRGLLLDAHEFKKLGVPLDQKVGRPGSGATASRVALPSLGFTSTWVLGSMYGVAIVFLIFLSEMGVLAPGLVLWSSLIAILLQFTLGPWIMDWSLRLFGSLNWVGLEGLPAGLRSFVEAQCRKEGIPTPIVGLISDGAPQAFTYGRTPWSARLVLSTGLLRTLDPDELETVVAHELGHARNWDFVIMTAAQLIPVVLYQVYRVLSRLSRGGKGEKGVAQALVVAWAAYVLYLISTYLVLFISRVREYSADRYSVDQTRKPNALVRALAKIAYGMVVGAAAPAGAEGNPRATEKHRVAVEAFGIMSIGTAKQTAILGETLVDPMDLAEIMRWDLWSPWARLYELRSTHPITARRFEAITARAVELGIEPEFRFDLTKPESYWDGFVHDLGIIALPFVFALVGYLYLEAPAALIGWGLGGILRTWMSYPGGAYLPHSVISLLKKVKVSPVQSYRVTLQGTVLGRGDPGNIFSEDMVLQDASGRIFLDYEHGIANWYFAFFKMDRFMGKQVTVEGWYRRAPLPYLEVARIECGGETFRSFSRFYRYLFSIGSLILGLVLV